MDAAPDRLAKFREALSRAQRNSKLLLRKFVGGLWRRSRWCVMVKDMKITPAVLDAIGNTPLVPLTRLAAGLQVPVLAKCEHFNPGGSIKDRIARAIVEDAEARGLLCPGATLIEATAGNTGVGLALMAAVRGYRLVCVLPEKMSVDDARPWRPSGPPWSLRRTRLQAIRVTSRPWPAGWPRNEAGFSPSSFPTRPTRESTRRPPDQR